MKATALSKIINITNLLINNGRKLIGINVAGLLIRVIKRCPATKLAANRTDKVNGRIIFLTNSIRTMKGIKI